MLFKQMAKRNLYLTNQWRPTALQTSLRTFSTATKSGDLIMGVGLDDKGEPRFLENVKLFLQRAAKQMDIPPDIYKYI